MKVIGKIGHVECAYQAEKTSERDGSKYWGEKYTIFFEVGDDIHLVDSGFIHCQNQNGGEAILERRGITVGAVGEMIMRYGYRDYNNRRFPTCKLLQFNAYNQSPAPSSSQTNIKPEATAEEVDAGFAEAAQDANINPETGLPF